MNDGTPEVDELSHGHSPAAWTAVVIMLIGFSLGTVFYTTNQPVGVVVSLVVIAVGLLVGYAMARAGYGVKGPKFQPKGH